MKWNLHCFAHLIFQLKKEAVSVLEMNPGQGNADNSLFDMVQVADLETGPSEFSVPLNFI